MFIVEFKEKNPITGKPYTPCGSFNTRIMHLNTIKGVENKLKNGVKPPKDTIKVCIYSSTNAMSNNKNFIKEFPIELVGINYKVD
jgi:hypothetical protein